MGHRVVAVEPTDELRIPAKALHPSPLTERLNDSLPDLARVRARGETFDVVMLTAVMHFDEQQRQHAMPNLASLIRAGGVMIMKIRHGPSLRDDACSKSPLKRPPSLRRPRACIPC
jgi:hypothetical protein